MQRGYLRRPPPLTYCCLRLVNAKGYDHTVLITDRMRAAGYAYGQYKSRAISVVVEAAELLV